MGRDGLRSGHRGYASAGVIVCLVLLVDTSLWARSQGPLVPFLRWTGADWAARAETPPASTTVPPAQAKYFPMTVGMSWSYLITVGKAKPLRLRQIVWPGRPAKAGMCQTRRGPLPGYKDTKDTYRLRLRVEAPAAKQGDLRWPTGVKLQVVADELGFYDDAKAVYYAAGGPPHYLVLQVAAYDIKILNGTGWEHDLSGADGHATDLAYFIGEPGTGIRVGGEELPTLTYAGTDTGQVGFEGVSLRHFVRTVPAEKANSGEQSASAEPYIVEDHWLAPRTGLVRLVQRAAGKTTMTWELEK